MSIRSNSKTLPALALCAALSASCAAALAADTPKERDTAASPNNAIEQLVDRVRDVFEQNKESVVRVISRDPYGMLCGTGFFVDPSGIVYTLAATVEGATEVEVQYGGKVLPARVLVADARSGIAILKVNATTPFLSLKSSSLPQVADPIVSIGYPMDLPASPAFGIVAGFDRKELENYFTTTHIRANLPVQNGQGGSPVLDINGKVVGIVVSCIQNGSGCYILPVEAVEKVRSDFMRFGGVKHGWIGVNVEDVKNPVTGSTARVADLDMSSPANGSGLRVGDILLQIGNVKVTCAEDILDASFFLTAGDVTPITYVRDGKTRIAHVEPDLHPIARRTEERTRTLSLIVDSSTPTPTPR